ncbi:MAG TPA: hypothetical protein VJT81_06495 [Burkholderiales bacterium]|nr:hypothetical protein [Burkholderiales bacterium]
MIQIYLIIGLVVTALMTGGGLWIRALKAENALLENAYTVAAQAAIDNQVALERQRAETARVDGILLSRDRDRRAAQKRTEDLNALLDNLKRTDQAVGDWSNAPVPDGVIRLLNGPEGAGQDRDPEAVPAGDADPADRPAGN